MPRHFWTPWLRKCLCKYPEPGHLTRFFFYSLAHNLPMKGERGMAKTKQKTVRAGKMPFALVMGWLAGIICTLLLASAWAQMILSETVGQSSAAGGSIVITAISAAVAAWVSALIAKKRWLQMCLVAGGMYFVTLLSLGGILFGGTFSGVGTGLITALGASTGVGLFALRGEKRASVKRNFKRYG
jgi:hypothetical protein